MKADELATIITDDLYDRLSPEVSGIADALVDVNDRLVDIERALSENKPDMIDADYNVGLTDCFWSTVEYKGEDRLRLFRETSALESISNISVGSMISYRNDVKIESMLLEILPTAMHWIPMRDDLSFWNEAILSINANDRRTIYFAGQFIGKKTVLSVPLMSEKATTFTADLSLPSKDNKRLSSSVLVRLIINPIDSPQNPWILREPEVVQHDGSLMKEYLNNQVDDLNCELETAHKEVDALTKSRPSRLFWLASGIVATIFSISGALFTLTDAGDRSFVYNWAKDKFAAR